MVHEGLIVASGQAELAWLFLDSSPVTQLIHPLEFPFKTELAYQAETVSMLAFVVLAEVVFLGAVVPRPLLRGNLVDQVQRGRIVLELDLQVLGVVFVIVVVVLTLDCLPFV